jgi:hypothetical protein
MNVAKYGIAEDSVLSYLPTEAPPENLVSNTLKSFQLTGVTGHILSWISAIAAEFERQAMWRYIRGYRFATYGLADTDYEYTGFAVLAYADPVAFGPEPTLIPLIVGNHSFPVFIRRGVLINHAPAIHPQMGYSCCWASSRNYVLDAILTAEHVVRRHLGGIPPKVGDMVAFLDKSSNTIGSGTVVDIAQPAIDAILVAPPPPPQGRTPANVPPPGPAINVNPYVAALSSATIAFASGNVPTKVTSVTDPNHWQSPYFPSRVLLSNWGQAGDSGTITFDSQNNAIGIYTGEWMDSQGRFIEGVAQHMGQAAHTMGLTLHD